MMTLRRFVVCLSYYFGIPFFAWLFFLPPVNEGRTSRRDGHSNTTTRVLFLLLNFSYCGTSSIWPRFLHKRKIPNSSNGDIRPCIQPSDLRELPSRGVCIPGAERLRWLQSARLLRPPMPKGALAYAQAFLQENGGCSSRRRRPRETD